tara:strand:- start:580 stop:1005 length:426 start_codon:yes stop_codon:yes gene_type:complete
MRILVLFLFVSFFAPSAFATSDSSGFLLGGLSSFFGFVVDILNSIYHFFSFVIPTAFSEFLLWISSWYLKMKFFSIYHGLEFAHSIAITFLDMINITNFVNSAISSLPNDMRQLASDIRFFDALTLVVEAWITKLVYSGSS